MAGTPNTNNYRPQLYIISTNWNLKDADAARPIADIKAQLATEKGLDALFSHDFMLRYAYGFEDMVERSTGQSLYPCIELNARSLALDRGPGNIIASYQGNISPRFLKNAVLMRNKRLTMAPFGETSRDRVHTIIDYVTNFGMHDVALETLVDKLGAKRIEILKDGSHESHSTRPA